MMWNEPCCVCRAEAQVIRHGDTDETRCRRCGHYNITGPAARVLELNPLNPRQIANLAGYLRENPGTTLHSSFMESDGRWSDRFQRVIDTTPNDDERTSKLLKRLAERHPDRGQPVGLDLSDPDLLGIAYALNGEELRHLFAKHAVFLGWIEDVQGETGAVHGTITPVGWSYLEEAKREGSRPRVGF